MEATEGSLDPLFGQRAAFPVSDPGSDAAKYLDSVRKEAEAMLLETIAQPEILAQDSKQPRKRPRVDHDQTLNYDELNLTRATTLLQNALGHDFEATTDIDTTLKAARGIAAKLKPNRPDCDSRATWRAFVWNNKPVPLAHEDAIRLLKYIPKWAQAPTTTHLGTWTLGLLLRLHDVLDGDDIAVVRDAVRSVEPLEDETLLHIIKRLAALQWGQSDL